MSINSKMTALADAIRDKSGVTGKLSISGMTTAVSNISVGGGESEPVDLSFITATAGDILSGKVGSDTDGNPVYGTLEITGGGDIDLSGVTVTADKMLSGIVAVGADGNKVTGNIQTVTPSVNKNTFTVGKGYVAEAFSQTIAEATVTETDSSVTITPGYVAEELTYDIGSGGDIDLSFVTAQAEHILLGKVGADKNGNPVEGTYTSAFDGTVQVLSWRPAAEACTGLSKIVVSGLGVLGDEDEGDTVDYSDANGTYHVTDATERIAEPFERIYRHENGSWYIWGEYDSESGEGYWYIGPAPDSGNLVYWTTGQLSDGTFTFEDYDYGYSAEVTLDVTETSYEASDIEIIAQETQQGALGAPVVVQKTFNSYQVVPQVGRFYEYSGTSLMGRALDIGNGIYGDDLLLLTHWGVPAYQSRSLVDESGNGCEITRRDSTDLYIDTSQATSLFGNPILYFNSFDSNGGHIVIKKVPKAFEFTIDYWEYLISDDDTKWGGIVIANKTCWDASGDLDSSTLISASNDASNKISKQWFHHAFVYDGNDANAIFEYINGVEIATHTWRGDVFYNENSGNVDYKVNSQEYNNERSIFGDDEYIFCPGGSAGSSSSKYVAQLAIWGRALSESELAGIVEYKQPYHL